MKLSEWIDIDHCSTRVLIGTDPEVVENRIAFIEKTPRVRVDRDTPIEIDGETYSPHKGYLGNWWIYGPKVPLITAKTKTAELGVMQLLMQLGRRFHANYQ